MRAVGAWGASRLSLRAKALRRDGVATRSRFTGLRPLRQAPAAPA
jgi:hypothetical protein